MASINLSATVLGAIRGQKLIAESIDPEAYTQPRNLDIFPKPLGSIVQSKLAAEQPIQYTLTQLKFMFQRTYRDEDHIENILVSSARYCKQVDDPKHEFLLLEVRDEKIPRISNYLVLDRTIQTASSRTYAAISTSVSGSPAHDRLRVSCYGDKELLVKQCNLGPYEELERLEFLSTPLLLCELVILAVETSSSRYHYNLMSAQCFWFAGCVWESMRMLVPCANHIQVTAHSSRGKYGNVFRHNVDKLETAGQGKLDADSEEIQQAIKENEELKRELGRLKQGKARDTILPVTTSHSAVGVHSEEVRHVKENKEKLGKRPGIMAHTTARAASMRVTPWGFTTA
ncbi:hypothetical protein BDV93DRAFT_566220 [Ceratobasidium sp. AG-I]|nr:hypothetical protein BDV93DRAFT_566220 [Ceratobasidium sp. AG-I]